MVNLYQILGVPVNADQATIYQTLQMRQANLPPKVVQAIQQYLLNPDIRPRYDEKLRLENPQLFQTTTMPTVDLAKPNVPLPIQNQDFNPYQAPTSMATTPAEQIGAIYNPNAAALWSILLTPFGMYLHAKNWETLGDDELAKQNIIFFWIIVALIFGVTIFEMLSGITIPNISISIIPLVLWYTRLGKKQIDYVKENFGDNYERLSLVKPVLIGIVGGYVIIYILVMILFVVLSMLGMVHPNYIEQ